jgi:TolA-binding protein
MNNTAHIVRGTILVSVAALLGLAVLIHFLRRSESPPKLIWKWVLTLLALAGIAALVRWLRGAVEMGLNPVVPVFGAGGAASLGLVITAIWRHELAGLVAKPFVSLYTGGDGPSDEGPLYSIAEAQRKRGHYEEAIRTIRAQLEKYPNDFAGQFLIAEIQAESMNDMPGAELTIHRLCAQPSHPPRHVVYALNTLADWQLKFSQDRDAARQTLEKIVARFPDSEIGALALQRIAHLADISELIASHDRRPITIKPAPPGLGLLPGKLQPRAPVENLEKQTADYVKQLAEHPFDTEAREKLATEQLEQMITHPTQPARRVVHWLNLLADLQIRHGANYDTVRRTLQRIIELYPDSPAAELAHNRLSVLRLELKGQAKGSHVKLGTYEQDVGLKRGLPHQL